MSSACTNLNRFRSHFTEYYSHSIEIVCRSPCFLLVSTNTEVIMYLNLNKMLKPAIFSYCEANFNQFTSNKQVLSVQLTPQTLWKMDVKPVLIEVFLFSELNHQVWVILSKILTQLWKFWSFWECWLANDLWLMNHSLITAGFKTPRKCFLLFLNS